MGSVEEDQRVRLLRRGLVLEYVTLAWNAMAVVVLGFAALAARSVALGGFGLDSLIEIGASAVVVWELSGTGEERQARAGYVLVFYAVRKAWAAANAAVPAGATG